MIFGIYYVYLNLYVHIHIYTILHIDCNLQKSIKYGHATKLQLGFIQDD